MEGDGGVVMAGEREEFVERGRSWVGVEGVAVEWVVCRVGFVIVIFLFLFRCTLLFLFLSLI